MLTEIPRFHRLARRALERANGRARDAGEEALTLGEFVSRGGFSRYFVSHFMTPLVSAVWSCDPVTALRYPAHYLFRFLDHHGMLTVVRVARRGVRSPAAHARTWSGSASS